MVTDVAKSKLFGGKKDEEIDPEQEDEIQYKDESKKTRFVNLKLTGKEGNYKISLTKVPKKNN